MSSINNSQVADTKMVGFSYACKCGHSAFVSSVYKVKRWNCAKCGNTVEPNNAPHTRSTEEDDIE